MADAPERRRAEVLLRRPGIIGAQGRVREQVLLLRAEEEAALADADRRLRAAADDRVAAAARIRACNRALHGTGTSPDADGAEILIALPRSDAFDDPLPDAATLRAVGGPALRAAVVELLDTLDRPTSVRELVRLLAAHGVTPAGRDSQAVSNALRADVRDGRVERVARGVYRSVPASDT